MKIITSIYKDLPNPPDSPAYPHRLLHFFVIFFIINRPLCYIYRHFRVFASKKLDPNSFRLMNKDQEHCILAPFTPHANQMSIRYGDSTYQRCVNNHRLDKINICTFFVYESLYSPMPLLKLATLLSSMRKCRQLLKSPNIIIDQEL